MQEWNLGRSDLLEHIGCQCQALKISMKPSVRPDGGPDIDRDHVQDDLSKASVSFDLARLILSEARVSCDLRGRLI